MIDTRFCYSHRPVIVDNDYDKAEEFLPMVHLVFSNLKAWFLGTHHGVSPKHLQAYLNPGGHLKVLHLWPGNLNEYVFRFNRRFYPMTVLGIAVQIRHTKICTPVLGNT